jgi:16S rRNA (guanine(527)-N(7))-methyltransferase RsmG
MATPVSLGDLIRREMSGVLDVTASQIDAMERHYELLLRWNRSINLTTVTERHEAATRHYCESLFLAAHVAGASVVDVGSGAGFPGIPVAIVHPDIRVDLVEAHQRKAVFLREATRELRNVRVWAARAESLEGGYGWLVSRAVDPTALLGLHLAERFAILLGEQDARRVPGARILPLPWGRNRVLCLGSFSNVPRETTEA